MPTGISSPALPTPAAPMIRPIVFFGGFASIGLELATSRLVAPYFGSSTFIWATLIGVTLTFLSLGYAVGGRLADRYPSPPLLYCLTATAATFGALIPTFARPILGASLAAFDQLAIGAFYGALLAVLLLLAIPVTLLGFVTPFAIRLRLADLRHAGNTAGGIYALSTVGSIAGSFVPVLILIPLAGTARTFLLLSLALLIPSIIGLLLARAWPLAVAALVVGGALPFIVASANGAAIRTPEFGQLIHERESSYNYIQVIQQGDRRYLALNEGHAIHSIYNPDPADLLTGGPWDYFMIAPLLVAGASVDTVDNALLIGLAGGTVARQLTVAYGPIPITGVEIDPEVAAVGTEYFGLAEMPNLEVVVADGRYALRTSTERFDLIGVDAYRQPYIPFQLTTREFFQEMADHLTPNGVAVVNAGRTATDFRLVDTLASTMRAVYASVYIIDVGDVGGSIGNSLVIGTNAPSSIEDLERNLSRFAPDSPLATVGRRAAESGNARAVATSGTVFTDDHAPVERVVDQIIVDAALAGEDQ